MKRLKEWLFGPPKVDKAKEARATGDWVASQLHAQVSQMKDELRDQSKVTARASRRHRVASADLAATLHGVLEKLRPENDNAAQE